MQNPVMMGLRAIVLLVCLVGVPLIAVFGKSAPAVVKALIKNYAGGSSDSAVTANGGDDATAFRPGLAASRPPPPSPQTESDPSAKGAPGASSSGLSRPLVPVADTPQSRSIPASADEIAPSREPSTKNIPPRSDHPVVQAAGGPAASRGADLTTASHADSAPLDASNASRIPPPGLPSPRQNTAARFPPDHFRAAEQRIRQLGATYYLLETLGPEGTNYRFYCKVADPENPKQILAFFATHADALAAMEDVVRQVEAWRLHLRQ